MKKYILFILVFFASNLAVKAQRLPDFGVLVGGTYYLGEVNLSNHFYSPSLAYGVLGRYNLNSRYSLRGSVFKGQLAANDLDSKYLYQNQRGVSFKRNVWDITAQFEFNFLSYGIKSHDENFTPYVAAGLALGYYTGFEAKIHSLEVIPEAVGLNSGSNFKLAIPFGVGMKVKLSKKWQIGCEWSFRKTFADNIDGLDGSAGIDFPDSPGSIDHVNLGGYKQRAYDQDNDWYSFGGVFITYKFGSRGVKCEAY